MDFSIEKSCERGLLFVGGIRPSWWRRHPPQSRGSHQSTNGPLLVTQAPSGLLPFPPKYAADFVLVYGDRTFNQSQ